MSDDWDNKLVIGNKAKAPKVTKNASDLNGASQCGSSASVF
jgi:putative transcription factor